MCVCVKGCDLTAKLRVESYAACVTVRRLVEDVEIVPPSRCRNAACPETSSFATKPFWVAFFAPSLVTFRHRRDARGRAPISEREAVDDMAAI